MYSQDVEMVLTMFSLILLRVIEEAHITCEFDVISVMLSTLLYTLNGICLFSFPTGVLHE